MKPTADDSDGENLKLENKIPLKYQIYPNKQNPAGASTTSASTVCCPNLNASPAANAASATAASYF